MTAPLHPIILNAPGSLGLNTEQAGASIDPNYALELTNAAFDSAGRMAARKGWAYETAVGNRHAAAVGSIGEFTKDKDSAFIIHGADNKLYVSDDGGGTPAPDLTNLTDRTGTNTPTANDWRFLNFNGSAVAVQAGHIPQVWDASSGNFADITTTNGAGAADADWGNAGLSAFGRLWVTDDTETVIYVCPTLMNLSSGDWGAAGGASINTAEVWPDGLDRIVALAEWQDRLVILGRRSVLIYVGPEDPTATTFELDDIVQGAGCVARDSVVGIGNDLLYLSDDGLRSLSRGIAFDTLPYQEISLAVRTELADDIASAVSSPATIKCGASRTESLYLARIGSSYWAFDIRGLVGQSNEFRSLRASQWDAIAFTAITGSEDGTLYLGQTGGVASYQGHQDNGSAYTWRYRSTWLELDQGAFVVPKYARVTFVTETDYAVSMKFSYGFDDGSFQSTSATTGEARSVAEYNIAEYGIGEYSGGGTRVNQETFQLGGFGDRLQLGLTIEIDGDALAVQRIDIFAKRGRLAA